jgi:hypothetical protein
MDGGSPEERVYVNGIPEPWTRGYGSYLTIEQTKELIKVLKLALKSKITTGIF